MWVERFSITGGSTPIEETKRAAARTGVTNSSWQVDNECHMEWDILACHLANILWSLSDQLTGPIEQYIATNNAVFSACCPCPPPTERLHQWHCFRDINASYEEIAILLRYLTHLWCKDIMEYVFIDHRAILAGFTLSTSISRLRSITWNSKISYDSNLLYNKVNGPGLQTCSEPVNWQPRCKQHVTGSNILMIIQVTLKSFITIYLWPSLIRK